MKRSYKYGVVMTALWGIGVSMNACVSDPSPIRVCAVAPNTEIGDCPKGCYPVQGRLAGTTVDCQLESPILGCADRPWAPSTTPDITKAPSDVISLEDGHRYSLAQEYLFWRETELEQPWFCETASDPKCPDPDPEITEACQVR